MVMFPAKAQSRKDVFWGEPFLLSLRLCAFAGNHHR
jgi:hypothetical protein